MISGFLVVGKLPTNVLELFVDVAKFPTSVVKLPTTEIS
jgi:hypothetical protein